MILKFEYAGFIIDSATKSQCKILDRLHEWALCLIYYRTTYEQGKRGHIDIEEFYNRYDISPLYVRRNQQLLSMMYNK